MTSITKIHLISITFWCTACSTENLKKDIPNSDTVSAEQIAYIDPKVDVRILLKDTILSYGDKTLLNISLTNNGNEVQKLLFDKPSISTGGPWGTSGNVIDVKTKQSVVKYHNKTFLTSDILSYDQPDNNWYLLRPGQTISKQFELEDIVVFNTPDYFLHRGVYEVQLFYHSNSSNVVRMRIK